MRTHLGVVATIALAGLVLVPAGSARESAGFSQPSAGARLTVAGDALQIDGQTVFLAGVSLFDALGPTPPRDQDLDTLASWGVRSVRVWAHWHEAIYQADGALTAPGRARLVRLAERLRARGCILELVLLRPGQLPGQPFAIFGSEAARAKAVDSMTAALREYRNVLFDLYNEHDHPDGPLAHAAARALRDRVKAIDANRVVTISSTEHHFMSVGGEIDESGARHLREETGSGADSVGVDVLAAHLPRTEDWASSSGARVRALRSALDRVGSHVPIYLNEERRAKARTPIQPDAYRRAFANARGAGAAGWVFHTAAGFELAKKPFLEALSADERAGLQSLRRP